MYTDATCVSGRQSPGPGDTAIPDSEDDAVLLAIIMMLSL